MISSEQNRSILSFLKTAEVTQQELHDELYDHIASSFEEALEQNAEQHIDDYLQKVVLPDFGGVEGIKKIIKKKNRELNKLYHKELMANVKWYFRWPMILVAISIYLVLHKCFQLFEAKHVLLVAIILNSIIPLLIGVFGFFSFYISCKRKRLPYATSVKNNVILTQVLLVSWAGHLPNFVKLVFGVDLSTMAGPILIVSVSLVLTFFTILALAYLKVLRQRFDFKLELI